MLNLQMIGFKTIQFISIYSLFYFEPSLFFLHFIVFFKLLLSISIIRYYYSYFYIYYDLLVYESF